MKKKFSVSAWVLSLIFSLVATFIFSRVARSYPIVLMGSFFLVMFLSGFLGMQLALVLSRKYEVKRPKNWVVKMLLAAILVFGIGAGGQFLFTYSKEEVLVPPQVDMVLLLDASRSMEGEYKEARTDAACQFIDGLSADHRVQIISFAATVLDQSALTTTDAAGKQTLKTTIQGINSTGNTDFDEPLSLAITTLKTEVRPNCGKAVLLLTDGDAPISDDVIDMYISNNIPLFSVRINSSGSMSVDAQNLVDAAIRTKGSDTELVPKADGSVDASDMLKAFQDAFQSTVENQTNMKHGFIARSSGVTLWQFIVRTVTFLLCMITFRFGYFGRFSVKSLIGDILSAVFLSVVISIIGGPYNSLLLLCLIMAASYVSITVQTSEDINV